MKLSSQLTISLFLSSFLLSAFGRASLAEVDPYLPTLKLKCSSTLYSSCKDSQTNPDKNFLLLLTCLEANSHKLDKQCQKEFFLYKFRLYTNPAFLSTLESVCGDEMSNLCEGKRGPKQIECLFKAGHPLVKGKCSSYLGQIGQVAYNYTTVLNDWNLINLQFRLVRIIRSQLVTIIASGMSCRILAQLTGDSLTGVYCIRITFQLTYLLSGYAIRLRCPLGHRGSLLYRDGRSGMHCWNWETRCVWLSGN